MVWTAINFVSLFCMMESAMLAGRLQERGAPLWQRILPIMLFTAFAVVWGNALQERTFQDVMALIRGAMKRAAEVGI